IPHQRNAGVRAARGETIVFTDAGCEPEEEWLARLVAPLREKEQVTAGLALAPVGRSGLYDLATVQAMQARYLAQCPTINMAFRREAYDSVDGFDEQFAYGSDMDFSWRLIDAGYRIRSVPDAVVRHDFGGWRRQLRRSYVYGQARVRLYRKHRARLKRLLLDDPVVVVYPVFLLGLPLTFLFPLYPALLLLPAWRNRSNGALRVVANHLTYGAGVLAELVSR
ncbi:MAG TPA: glycosyltransferase family 2 protein, partial [Streptosporangiaceae bacterium]|nr:glycosyltransferase family 2 protein [Streptosporangiaceae bacterium]